MNSDLEQRLVKVRAQTVALTETLTAEDMQIQSMEDVSPTKWHLAHTTWFFETFVLESTGNYEVFHPRFRVLFNSYYLGVGDQHPRPERGFLSRPSLEEVLAYRIHVDQRLLEFIGEADDRTQRLIGLGLQHEQQHQELLLMDIKHVFASNPLGPVLRPEPAPPSSPSRALRWFEYGEGLHEIGHAGDDFAFDNESPRHRVFVDGFALASRCVTNGEWLEFVESGAYNNPAFWLSDGWALQQSPDSVDAPAYWRTEGGRREQFTLHGWETLRLDDPVMHLSYYEADAYARWAGYRLPTEAEWEIASADCDVHGNFLENNQWHARAAQDDTKRPAQLFGDVWEWTSSAYAAYPGFRLPEGAVGEYNGKFMSNQFVLRGGSWATPKSHIRRSYRNFFHPHTRWHFSGIRLARDL